ncbi:MAG TPA: branched-chain amino acid ABC transporter permease [Kofleriaceae bacterium]|jgi:branched-chain amino acid transport system permease protein|nr:branched-chain amino acid ABC transporter permease [Kofleriaceae bacterium]
MTAVSVASPIAAGGGRPRIRRGSLWLGALLAIALVGPFVVSGYRVFQLSQVIVYAIALLGLNLLTGFSGQISLGNGAFYAIGGYVAVIVMTKAGLPYWAAPPIAGAVCFLAGSLFGRTATRLEGLYLALATFGLATATPQILKLDALESWTGGNQGIVITKPGSPVTGLINDDQWLYLFCLAVAIALFVIAWNMVRGRTGRALVALRDHPIAAATMGIDVAAYKTIAFGVSAMYTGVAGALGVLITGFISPDSFPTLVSIQFLVGSVLGGIASIFGTLFGAAFIELVPDLAKKASDAAPQAVFGVVLIACMMVMPGGLAGLVYSVRARLARGTIRRHRAES